jgi:cytochrome P450
MGWNQNVAVMRYGDGWRQHRKLCQQNFDAEVSKQYHPIQLTRVHRFLCNVLDSPENVFDHITL